MVLIAGVALFAFVLGYVLATSLGDASQQDLQQENAHLYIENEQLKRSHR